MAPIPILLNFPCLAGADGLAAAGWALWGRYRTFVLLFLFVEYLGLFWLFDPIWRGMRFFRFGRVGSSSVDAGVFLQRARAGLGAGVDGGLVVLFVERRSDGLWSGAWVSDAGVARNAHLGLADAVGGRAEEVDGFVPSPVDAVGWLMCRGGGVGRASMRDADPGEAGALLGQGLRVGCWVGVVLRAGRSGELRAFARWVSERVGASFSGPSHPGLEPGAVVGSVFAGGPDASEVRACLELVPRCVPGFDYVTGTRVVTHGGWVAGRVGGVLAPLVLAVLVQVFVGGQVGGLVWFLAVCASLVGLVRLGGVRYPALAGRVGRLFGVGGFKVFRPRRKLWPASNGAYPLDRRCFVFAPGQVAGLVSPSSGAASGVVETGGRSTPPVLLSSSGVAGPWVGASSDGDICLQGGALARGVAVTGEPGSGKRLTLSTPVRVPGGWKRMGDLAVGDVVVGGDGSACQVVFVSQVENNPRLFRVTCGDGQFVFADGDHQWLAFDGEKWRVVCTDDFVAGGNWWLPVGGVVAGDGGHYELAGVGDVLDQVAGGVVPGFGVGVDADWRLDFARLFLARFGDRKFECVPDVARWLVRMLRSAGVPARRFAGGVCVLGDVLVSGRMPVVDVSAVGPGDRGFEPARCIQVDSPDSTYQVLDGVVTHNTRLVEGLWAWLLGDALRTGRRHAFVAFDSKGDGVGQYAGWAQLLGANLDVVDVDDASSLAIDMFVGGSVADRARRFVSAMVYAWGEQSIGARATEVLTGLLAGGLCVNADDVAAFNESQSGGLVRLDPDAGPVEFAHVLAGGKGDEAGVGLFEILSERARGDVADGALASDALEACQLLSPVFAGVTPAARRSLVESSRNKLDELCAFSSWFSPSRQRAPWSQLLDEDRVVVVNFGHSATGRVVDEQAGGRLSAMLMFGLREAIASTCYSWGELGRRVSVVSDELAVQAGYSDKVFSWFYDQGRAFGVWLLLATQRPGQLPDRLREVFLTMGTLVSYRQNNPDVAASVATQLSGGDGEVSAGDVMGLPRWSALVRTNFDDARLSAFVLKVADFAGDKPGTLSRWGMGR